jgi:ABC-type enterochelin transport system permease subunit
MSDWIFAFFHLFLLVGIIVYAFVSLARGNAFRFAIIMICLVGYYFLVLHKPVKREIERRKKLKN